MFPPVLPVRWHARARASRCRVTSAGVYHQRRLDGAQRQYLEAIRCLAQVRQLLAPAVHVYVAEQPVNVVQ